MAYFVGLTAALLNAAPRDGMPPTANGGMQRGVYGRAQSPYNAEAEGISVEFPLVSNCEGDLVTGMDEYVNMTKRGLKNWEQIKTLPDSLTFAGRACDNSALQRAAAAVESIGSKRLVPPRTPPLQRD